MKLAQTPLWNDISFLLRPKPRPARPMKPPTLKMPPRVRERFNAEILKARANTSDPEVAWPALERAHVLGQFWPWPHVRIHWEMLRYGWEQGDFTEVAGQLIRLAIAYKGSTSGRIPVGNNGRARVPLSARAPLPPDIAALLDSVGIQTSGLDMPTMGQPAPVVDVAS